MDKLNEKIMSKEGIVGVGGGTLTPKYIFVGQNPGQKLIRGEKFWSRDEGSPIYLRRALKELAILDDCYLTNLVKEATQGNSVPSDEMLAYWMPIYKEEIALLQEKKPMVITMGAWATDKLRSKRTIYHPSAVARGAISYPMFVRQIKEATRSATHTYPKIQSVVRGTVFIMAEAYDSKNYDTYEIRFQQGRNIEIGSVTHEALATYIEQKIAVRKSLLNFANGHGFIKIPIKCLNVYGKDNIPLKQLSLIP